MDQSVTLGNGIEARQTLASSGLEFRNWISSFEGVNVYAVRYNVSVHEELFIIRFFDFC